MKIAKSAGSTSPAIVSYVIQWIDSQTPDELRQKAESGYRLLDDLKSVQAQVKAAKLFVKLEVDPESLLTEIVNKRPEKGMILNDCRAWYLREISILKTYIENL